MKTDCIASEYEKFATSAEDLLNAVEMGGGGDEKGYDFVIVVRGPNATGMLTRGKGDCGSVEEKGEEK